MMRILLVTPYAPHTLHAHAASDVLTPLVRRLAEVHDVHVYTTDPGPLPTAADQDFELSVSDCPPRSRVGAALGRSPYWVRAAWPRGATREVASLARRLGVELVHCEYLQTASALSAVGVPTVLTLHDVSTDVMRRAYEAVRGVKKPYRFAELHRTRPFEAYAVSRATVPVALSASDARWFARFNPEVVTISPGVAVPSDPWGAGSGGTGTVVFVGAMWRAANEAAAVRLVDSIMPRVWARLPAISVRIVGADPTQTVVRLQADSRVTVTGRVGSVEDEMRGASVVVCPTVFGGGVLMKLARALALGAPVVADARSAASLGVPADAIAIASSDEAFADRVIELVNDQPLASRVGKRARAFATEKLTWDNAVRSFSAAYRRAVEVGA